MLMDILKAIGVIALIIIVCICEGLPSDTQTLLIVPTFILIGIYCYIRFWLFGDKLDSPKDEEANSFKEPWKRL